MILGKFVRNGQNFSYTARDLSLEVTDVKVLLHGTLPDADGNYLPGHSIDLAGVFGIKDGKLVRLEVSGNPDEIDLSDGLDEGDGNDWEEGDGKEDGMGPGKDEDKPKPDENEDENPPQPDDENPPQPDEDGHDDLDPNDRPDNNQDPRKDGGPNFDYRGDQTSIPEWTQAHDQQLEALARARKAARHN